MSMVSFGGIKLPSYKDDRVGLSSSQVNKLKGESTKSAGLQKTGNILSASVLDNSAPFSARTEQLWKETTGEPLPTTGDKYKGIEYDGVKTSYLTTQNWNYINYYYDSRGMIKGGYTHGSDIWNDADSWRWYPYRSIWYSEVPEAMILPNCVGGARGRYQELSTDPDKLDHSYSLPSLNPVYWKDNGAFKDHEISKVEKSGYKRAGTDFYLWEDVDGDWGSKGGLWGWGRARDGAPPIPGACVTWLKPTGDVSHVGFIEAVYNFGQDDCYFISTESNYGAYVKLPSDFFNLVKRSKSVTAKDWDGGTSPYAKSSWAGNWGLTTFLYTPLCDFSGTGSIFKRVELNYEAPSEEQQEAYRQIVEIINGNILKVGDHVQIEQLGNEKSDGTGKPINKINMGNSTKNSYIGKILDNGVPFKYQVVDKKVGGKLIGYYSREGLHLIEE